MGVLDEALQDQVNDPVGVQIKITNEPDDVLVELSQVVVVAQGEQQQGDLAVALVGLAQQVELCLLEVHSGVQPGDLIVVAAGLNELALGQSLVSEDLERHSFVNDASGAEVDDQVVELLEQRVVVQVLSQRPQAV